MLALQSCPLQFIPHTMSNTDNKYSYHLLRVTIYLQAKHSIHYLVQPHRNPIIISTLQMRKLGPGEIKEVMLKSRNLHGVDRGNVLELEPMLVSILPYLCHDTYHT